jgi:hypothetical protein
MKHNEVVKAVLQEKLCNRDRVINYAVSHESKKGGIIMFNKKVIIPIICVISVLALGAGGYVVADTIEYNNAKEFLNAVGIEASEASRSDTIKVYKDIKSDNFKEKITKWILTDTASSKGINVTSQNTREIYEQIEVTSEAYNPDDHSKTESSSGASSSTGKLSSIVNDPGVVTSHTDPNVSISPSIDTEITSDTARITSAQVKSIKAGNTYKEIINAFPRTANYAHFGLRQYLIDNEKILVLRFNDINDVCELSGNELLATTKSYKYPGGNIPKSSDQSLTTVYGIVIDDNFISCIGNKGDECYSLLIGNAEIVFQNGAKASKSDIKLMKGILVTFDYALTSFPPQAHCTKIVILD